MGASGEGQSEKNTIQLPECPQCKTLIRRSFRYAKYIKAQQTAINEVKMRIDEDDQIKGSSQKRVADIAQRYI